MYWVKTHWIIKNIFQNYIWDKKDPTSKKVYVTFDDGPIPVVTEWVLDCLKSENVKAHFFCVGENITKHPAIFNRVLEDQHIVGNHTYNHINGWESDTDSYFDSVVKTEQIIKKGGYKTQKLFRPPYGKISFKQSFLLRKKDFKIVMWDVLSADFDTKITANQCLKNVIDNTSNGSIVVFHDNIKSFEKLQYVLPRYIHFLKKEGYEVSLIC